MKCRSDLSVSLKYIKSIEYIYFGAKIMGIRVHSKGRALWLVALLTTVSGPVLAQTQVAALDTVLVTAERRETSVQDTPLSVKALNAEELEKRAFRRVNDLAGLAPGLTVPNQNYSNQFFFIRGVGTGIASGNPMVGFYIDDVYIPRPFGIGWVGNLPDIEQIEIINGPQGTLYGMNSAAGAIKLNSRKPTDEFKAWAEIGAGNLNALEARGYISGGIIPGLLSASFAVSHLNNDGPDYNPHKREKAGGLANQSARAILNYTPSSDLEVLFSFDYMRDRSEYRTGAQQFVAGAGLRRTFSEVNSRSPHDGGGVTLRASYNIDESLTLKSITAFRFFDTWGPVDSDGLPTYQSGFTRHITQNTYSQEFQLQGSYDAIEFTTGLAWFREILRQYRFSWQNSTTFSGQFSNNLTEDFGFYGQVKYHITDDLSATAGVRVNRETKGMDSSQYRSNVLGALTSLLREAYAPGTVLSYVYSVRDLEQVYWAVTPKFILDYKVAPETLLYASWSSGEGSGGYNQASPTLAVATLPVDPTTVSTTEVGLKTTFWDGRIQTNAAAFYNDFKNYQATITNPVIGGTLLPGTFQVNAGNATIYGAEFEVRAKPTNNLETQLAATFLKSRFDSYLNPTGAATSNYVGQELPFAPRFSIGFGATYTIPFADNSEIRLFGSYRYESTSYSDITPYRQITKFPNQDYVDASITYVSPDEDWTLTVKAKNLLGADYRNPIGGAYNPAANTYAWTSNWPRQVVVSLRRDF